MRLVLMFSFPSVRCSIRKDPPPGVSASLMHGNLMTWKALILGPQDTPFENGTFRMTIEFPIEYPHLAPTFRFMSRVFHPNVYEGGLVCLDIYEPDQWNPTYEVGDVLSSIRVICLMQTVIY